jgi:iron complex outermembrane receptor protein
MKKLFLVLLTGIVLQTAFTQETPDSTSSAQESDESLDFVITAGRTPEAANKVSSQVTVITADDIAESGATTVVDVLQRVPGIRFTTNQTGTGGISMRGISGHTGHGKVLVIVDGMRLNPIDTYGEVNWDVINLSEIERIEVLDGGASVQYGDNAQAGVINIITKKSGAAKTDITVSGGSFYQNEQRFSHHQPTNWGGFSVSGGHRGSQGYQKHSSSSDTGNGELQGVFDINDTMSLQANVGFAFTNGLFANGLSKVEFDDDPTQSAGMPPSFSRPAITAGMGYTWAINEIVSFDLPVSYNFTNYRYYAPASSMVYDMTPQMLGIRPKITAELKPADMSLRFTGGVDALFAFNEVKTSYDPVKESNPTVQTASEITLGPWVLVSLEPLAFLSLNAGLRYETAFVNGHMDSWSGSVFGTPMSYTSEDVSTQWDAFVYETGITVNPFDFLKVYTKYGTQFRYPYTDDIIVAPGVTGAGTIGLNTGLEPEKGWTVEGGIGLTIKNIARLDANIYYLRIDNEIFQRPVMPYISENMDPINRFGTNIGLELTPIKYASLDFNYSFVNAEFSEGTHEGKVVPLVANHTLSASLMLHAPFGLSLGPNVLYKSEMYAIYDFDNTQQAIDSSLIWGLQARYVIDKFKGELAVMLTVHNLADTKYASWVYALPTGLTYYVDKNMGRSVNLSLQYRY